MRENLTDTLRGVLAEADKQARALNQEFVSTEHLFLGILHREDCQAFRCLLADGVNLRLLKTVLLQALGHGREAPVVTGSLPLSPKSLRVLNNALVRAQAMRTPRVSTRLLLLALLDEPQNEACQALRQSGADVDRLVLKLAQPPEQAEP